MNFHTGKNDKLVKAGHVDDVTELDLLLNSVYKLGWWGSMYISYHEDVKKDTQNIANRRCLVLSKFQISKFLKM